MDKARSQYPAESATEKIHQEGNSFDITMTEMKAGHAGPPMVIHLTADNNPSENRVGPNSFKATTHWENNKLVTFVEGDRGQHMTEVRELSRDGNVLTVTGYHQDEMTKPYYVRVMVKGQ